MLSPDSSVMANVLSKLKKLKGRSPDELRQRGVQALSALAERRGISPLVRLPSDLQFWKKFKPSCFGSGAVTAGDLLAHFRARSSPPFFAAFDDKDSTIQEFERRFAAGSRHTLIERANRIVSGRFDLLGLGDLSFGDPIDWHLEPVQNKRAPAVHWSRINYLDSGIAGDKKIVWELNRHQYFSTLGRAYWCTASEDYARTFAAHLDEWMLANPPKLGINWASSLEVAFRAISWVWGLYFFRDSPHLTAHLFLRALKFLYLHARHLETYLSTYFSPNTHLTGEALGLYYLGTIWPEFRLAARWRSTGLRVLLESLDHHIGPDGVYYERSTYYHRYTTDFYLHLLILARSNGDETPARLTTKLTAMLEFLMYVTRPDGTAPLVGDDDGGRLVMLDERRGDDFRATIATGAAVFNRADFRAVAGEAAEETLWLLGSRGIAAFEDLKPEWPEDASRGFTDSGCYVMRDGWSREADFIFVGCGPHGAGLHGHSHADALSFDLSARGRALLVDPGTYTYTGSVEARNWFRSSRGHNTLLIDGATVSVPAENPFRWKRIESARVAAWQTHPRFDHFTGALNAQENDSDQVSHIRSLLFLKGCYVIMRDRVIAKGSHEYQLLYHFAAGAEPVIDRDSAVRERPPFSSGMEMFAFGGDGRWRRETGWVSGCYGARTEAPILAFVAQASGNQDFISFLVSREAGAARVAVVECAAAGGKAFSVSDHSFRDLVISGAGNHVEAEGFRSDFEWLWARLDTGSHEPEQLVLLNGSYLEIDGTEFIRAPGRIGWIVARRGPEGWRAEADGRAIEFRMAGRQLSPHGVRA